MSFASPWKFLILLTALGAIAVEAQTSADIRETLAEVEAPAGSWTPIFRATGVTASSTRATVVHCTNVGSEDGNLFVSVFNWNGDFDCQISPPVFAPDRTITVGTRSASAYLVEATCPAPGPLINQGYLVVYANPAGSQDFLCTVQVLDSESSPPVFSLDLDVYDTEGNLIDPSYIFSNGFDLRAWRLWTEFVN